MGEFSFLHRMYLVKTVVENNMALNAGMAPDT